MHKNENLWPKLKTKYNKGLGLKPNMENECVFSVFYLFRLFFTIA